MVTLGNDQRPESAPRHYLHGFQRKQQPSGCERNKSEWYAAAAETGEVAFSGTEMRFHGVE